MLGQKPVELPLQIWLDKNIISLLHSKKTQKTNEHRKQEIAFIQQQQQQHCIYRLLSIIVDSTVTHDIIDNHNQFKKQYIES
ncbi:hypothetical protein DERF_010322 [Dermatophagoides farinae]|uniref:Uncharacterized protein n=1 Tax=Dermatophagoides farinae TaxID=6954 RepID=A0A922L6R9_DERFA|nr:hypothetical protein DERF_010322 [Dermatophagoides farinae]